MPHEILSADEFKSKYGRKGRSRITRPGAASPRLGPPLALPATFTLDMPPSVNHLFATVRDNATGVMRRVLSAKARIYKRGVLAAVTGNVGAKRLLELRIVIHANAFTKAGEVRQFDASNRIKFLEDCLALALGFNDRQVFRLVVEKVHSTGKPGVTATLADFVKS